MARKLDTSSATATIVQPVKAETLKFMQDSVANQFIDVLSSLLGISGADTTPRVLYGCIASGGTAAAPASITAGAIFWTGEIFEVAAASLSYTGSQVAIMNLVTTQDTTNADPVTFSDQVQRNVHNIRTIQIVAGTSGAGSIADFTACSFQNLSISAIYTAINAEISRAKSAELNLQNQVNYINGIWGAMPLNSTTVGKTGAGSISSISGVFNFSNNVGNTTIGNLTLNITIASTVTAITITLPVTWSETTYELGIESANNKTMVLTKSIATNTIVITPGAGGNFDTGTLVIYGSVIGQTTT